MTEDFKKTLVLLLVISSLTITGQITQNTWHTGIGFGIIKYDNTSDSKENYLNQTPRLSIANHISDYFTIEAAMSYNLIKDSDLFITNNINYINFEVNVRYKFIQFKDNVEPYVLVGASLIKNRKITGAINMGAGINFWISKYTAINIQSIYKYSDFGVDKSHINFSAGVILLIEPVTGRRRCN